MAVLCFPWGISAYYVERAGRWLDAQSPSAAGREAAERALLRALQWYPGNAQAYRLLARLHRDSGDQIAALEAQARFVALRPKSPVGLWELAKDCERIPGSELAQVPGQPCGVDAAGRQAMLIHLWERSGHTAGSFVEAANTLRKAEEWTEAEAFYGRALLLDPASAAAWRGLAQLQEARSRPDQALESYAQIIAGSEDGLLVAAAHHDRGRILADTQRWAEASQEYGQAVALVPEEGQYHLDYGWALFKAGGKSVEARSELAEAASLMPEDPWPHVQLSQVAYAAQDYSKALEHAQQAIALRPDLFWGWMRKGAALRRLDRLAESEEALRHAVELQPNRAVVHVELGYTLQRQEEMEEAIEEFQRAVSLVPGNLQYSLSLAGAYRRTGRVPEAVEMYRRVLEQDPDNPAAQDALRDLGY